jgi:hypothetical protein
MPVDLALSAAFMPSTELFDWNESSSLQKSSERFDESMNNVTIVHKLTPCKMFWEPP